MKNQLIKEKQDLTYLSWALYRNTPGTVGSFLKAYSELGGKKIYYKLSNFDKGNGVVGHESVNELIVDRLLTILGVPHLSYQLIHADIIVDGKQYEVYLCASEDFKDKGESKVSLDSYRKSQGGENISVLDFCIQKGWEEYIYQMLVVDYLVLNRDRHGANIEVLRNSRKHTVRLAPLFDHGLSLLALVKEENYASFDVMQDLPCNNHVGTRSTWENLKLIPVNKMPRFRPLLESDRDVLFEGLEDVLSQVLQDKIWEMIWKRWCAYEDFCNSR